SDGFVAKFDTTQVGASSLIFSTFLGGSLTDIVYDVAVDTAGNLHLVGGTQSTNFPQVDAISSIVFLTQPFVAKMNPAGSALIYSTFFGGQTNGQPPPPGPPNPRGDPFAAGNTNTNRPTPPLADGHPMVAAFDNTYGGGDRDAVIGRIGNQLNPADSDEDG